MPEKLSFELKSCRLSDPLEDFREIYIITVKDENDDVFQPG